MDYLKRQKDWSGWIHVLWKYFSNYDFLKSMHNNLKEIGIVQAVWKFIIVVNLWISKLRSSLH